MCKANACFRMERLGEGSIESATAVTFSCAVLVLGRPDRLLFNADDVCRKLEPQRCIVLRKITIYLLTSCNTEERIAQNIYFHNSNRNYIKLTTTTILIKNRIGIGYKNYGSCIVFPVGTGS